MSAKDAQRARINRKWRKRAEQAEAAERQLAAVTAERDALVMLVMRGSHREARDFARARFVEMHPEERGHAEKLAREHAERDKTAAQLAVARGIFAQIKVCNEWPLGWAGQTARCRELATEFLAQPSPRADAMREVAEAMQKRDGSIICASDPHASRGWFLVEVPFHSEGAALKLTAALAKLDGAA